MKKSIWFSRHAPAFGQVADAEAIGYCILGVKAGMVAGARSMDTDTDVRAVNEEIHASLVACGAEAVFGVFPAPLRALWHTEAEQCPAEVWEALNVTRTAEGGKPTFTHKKFVRTI